jgi:hypothetical protein
MTNALEKTRTRPRHFRLDDRDYFVRSDAVYHFHMRILPTDIKTLGCVFSGIHHAFVAEVFGADDVVVPALGGTTMMEMLGILIEPQAAGEEFAFTLRPVWCRALSLTDARVQSCFERVFDALFSELRGTSGSRMLNLRSHREVRRMVNHLQKNAKRISIQVTNSVSGMERKVELDPR